jgi:restriction endonuclease S subunit
MSETAWTQSTLADITLNWYVGTTPDRRQTENFGSEGLPWVRVEDITSNVISSTTECLTNEGIRASKVKLVPPGAILVSTSGTIGKVAMAGTTLTMNQAVQALVVDSKIVLPRYVYYYLQFVHPQLWEITNHVTIPNLPKTVLQKFPIFYPSLVEQRSIVAELDKVETLSGLKKAEFARLDDYLLSLFSHCFHGELEGSRQIRLDVIADLSSGIRSRQSDSDEGRPLVNGFGGQTFSLHDTSSFVKTIPPKNAEKYLLRQDDILVRRKLPAPPEPCAILVSEQVQSALLGANLIRIRITDDTILPAYLFSWLLLSHRQGKLPIMGNYHTDVDISRAKSILVPAASLDSQKRFAHYFTQYLHLSNLLTANNSRLESLTQSMLEYAFSGKITYHWREENNVPHPSRTVFNVRSTWTENDEMALYHQNLTYLTTSMRAVIKKMSAFQRALLKQLMRTNRPKAIHELLGELQTNENAEFISLYNIQDAIQAMYVLELLGFVEHSDVLLETPEYNSAGVLTNPDGTPISIQLQILSRDIFKESSDETPETVH